MDAPSQETIVRWLQGGVLTGLLTAAGWAVRTWLWRKKPAADIHLTGSQAEVNFADAEAKRVTAKRELFDMAIEHVERLEAKLIKAEATVEQLRERERRIVRLELAVKRVSDERDKSLARVKMLEGQLSRYTDTEGDEGGL